MFEIVYFVVYDYDTVLLFKDYPLPASLSYFPPHTKHISSRQSEFRSFSIQPKRYALKFKRKLFDKGQKTSKNKMDEKKTIFELKTIKFRCTHNKSEVVNHEKC